MFSASAAIRLQGMVPLRKTETQMPVKSAQKYDQKYQRCAVALSILGSFLLLGLCFGSSVAETLPAESTGTVQHTSVTEGSVINRELARGAKEVFGIWLSPGDLLRLSLDKGDLAISLTLYDPRRQKLVEQVSYSYEPVDLSLPVETAGTYLIEICSLELDESVRWFRLKFEPVRPATPIDHRRAIAERATASANMLRANWTEKSLRQAVENYEEAALIWVSLHEVQRAVVATMKAAEVRLTLGEYREALRLYQKAAAQARNAGARFEESAALSETGRLHSYLGNNGEAQRRVLEALKLLAFESQTDATVVLKGIYAQSLSNAGEVSYSKGNLLKSSKHFEHALKLFAENGDRSGKARAHLFLGYIYGGLGDPEKAVAELSQALGHYRAIRNKTGEGLSLTALGLAHSLNGSEEQAITMHRDAIGIFRVVGDRQSEAIAISGIGQAYERLTQDRTALGKYQEALQLFQDNGSLDFAAVALFNIAGVYQRLGDRDQALAYYEKCLKLSRSAKKVRTEANALNDVAGLYAAQGDHKKSIWQYRKVLRFYAGISDRPGQANAWNNMGDAYFRIGEKQNALRSYSRALPLSEQAGDKAILISSLYNIALAQRDLGDFDLALASIERSINIIEDLRVSVTSPDSRISYFSGVRKHYDLSIDILMQLDQQRPGHGFNAAALLTSEKARARSLLDILTSVGTNIRREAAPELLARERHIRGLLRSQALYQMELSTSETDPDENEEVARQINQLTTEYREIESQLNAQNPGLPGFDRSALASLDQVQAQLSDGGTILLEYALGDERSYLWAVTADSLRSYELPSRSTLEEAAGEVYALLTARQVIGQNTGGDYQAKVEKSDRAYYEKAQKLSQLLLGPVADQLGTKRIIIVTEGILQHIPVDSLPPPQPELFAPAGEHALPAITENHKLLLDTNEVVTLPSVSTLGAIRERKPNPRSSDKIVAIFADPVFNSNDERFQNRRTTSEVFLPDPDTQSSDVALRSFVGSGGPQRLMHSSAEADAIVATIPRGTAMVARAFEARRETAMRPYLGDYQIIHFATHGFFNSEHPELSGILLSMMKPDGSKINGFMPLQDIYKLNLSAQLVVVSACDTALGEDIKGEGLVSLTRGFLHAGSKSVVTSLWKVDDRATAKLMKYFYESMLRDGMTPAAALRTAKQKIRSEKAWSAPFFWAGFVLQGEYRERIVVESDQSHHQGLLLSISLVLISVGVMIMQRRRRSRMLNSNLNPGRDTFKS